jgi:hypothetical protein
MRRDYLEIVRSGIDSILQGDGSDYVSKYQECQRVLGQTISEIMLDLHGKPFRNTAEEIRFYKEDAPHIWGLYMFYTTLVKIEAARKFEPKETFRAGLEAKLKQAETFFEEQHCVCAYYYEGRTDKDERLFTRRGSHNGKNPLTEIRIDRDFTRGASLLSLMRANELLQEWLTSAFKAAPESKSRIKLKWEGAKVALIEVLKAMHLNGDFGDVTFQHVMDWASQEFGVNTKNHDVALQNAKNRKIDTTKYLNVLIKMLNGDTKP